MIATERSKIARHPGPKSCGDDSLDKTIKCLCNPLKKNQNIRAGTIKRVCGLDNNQAHACLETLAPEIDELDIWGGFCEDGRRLIRKSLYIWRLSSPI